MSQVTFKKELINLAGQLPAVHTKAPNFLLIDKNLKEHSLQSYQGKRKLLTTVPSLDTGVCSAMTKHFNAFAKKHKEFLFITVSADLPFAQKRFCEQENVHNTLTLSTIRDRNFGQRYGVLMVDGPLANLLARSVFVLDEKDHILYQELVPEITQEPNYHSATESLLKHR